MPLLLVATLTNSLLDVAQQPDGQRGGIQTSLLDREATDMVDWVGVYVGANTRILAAKLTSLTSQVQGEEGLLSSH